jgi:hypothetical protein
MEMNRRRFLKLFFVVSAASAAGWFLLERQGYNVKLEPAAGKIKKYPGRIRTDDSEIGLEGRWVG